MLSAFLPGDFNILIIILLLRALTSESYLSLSLSTALSLDCALFPCVFVDLIICKTVDTEVSRFRSGYVSSSSFYDSLL